MRKRWIGGGVFKIEGLSAPWRTAVLQWILVHDVLYLQTLLTLFTTSTPSRNAARRRSTSAGSEWPSVILVVIINER
ncbi:uncharacterized protein BDZ99DRAFT_464485 [Mytilinidion resinicola]|uniref:Uncharacterized protein n=1 Tax=Mytilinidion resinicola TaxID=574789 RepID=A0A6A6YIL5_9PEZI|nr:uncharacterized protein BDZ99DRAFT_464485 [Mytilinidion resinicola]KAF2808641.1 hypothetical protein BDZ99DRAFT_464485 [Mytilinidion resinicola]